MNDQDVQPFTSRQMDVTVVPFGMMRYASSESMFWFPLLVQRMDLFFIKIKKKKKLKTKSMGQTSSNYLSRKRTGLTSLPTCSSTGSLSDLVAFTLNQTV